MLGHWFHQHLPNPFDQTCQCQQHWWQRCASASWLVEKFDILTVVPEKPHKSLQNLESEERKWMQLHSRSDSLSCRDWNAYLKVPKHGNKLQSTPHGRFWWCVNFCGNIFSFWRSRGRTMTEQLFRAQSAEGRGKGMFAEIFSAFLQKSSFQEAVQAALGWAQALLLLVGYVPHVEGYPKPAGAVGCAVAIIYSQRPSAGCSSMEISPCRVRATRAWLLMKVMWLHLELLSFLLLLMPVIIFFQRSLCKLTQ